MARPPRWWTVAALLQRALAAVALAGAVWLLVLIGLGFLRLDDVLPLPEVRGIALPTLLLVGGALAGLLLALVLRLVNRSGARRRARRARRALDERIEATADEVVLEPVQAELAVRDRLCASVATARSS